MAPPLGDVERLGVVREVALRVGGGAPRLVLGSNAAALDAGPVRAGRLVECGRDGVVQAIARELGTQERLVDRVRLLEGLLKLGDLWQGKRTRRSMGSGEAIGTECRRGGAA